MIAAVLLVAAAMAAKTPEVVKVPDTKSAETPTAKAALSPADALSKTLGDKRYTFCHDKHYPLSDREGKWCDLVKGQPSACKALQKNCESAGTGGRQFDIRRPKSFDLPNLGGLFSAFFWGVTFAAAATVLVLLVRALLLAKRKRPVLDDIPTPITPGISPSRVAVESDFERLLARAQGAIASGRFNEAVFDLHAAALRSLEGPHLVSVHRSKTNGDYVRELRSNAPELVPALKPIVAATETVQFGGYEADESTCQTLLESVRSLGRQSMARITAFFLVPLCLSLSACGGMRDNWDHSPSGLEGVIHYLHEAGLEVKEKLTSLEKIDANTTQLVLLADAQVSEAEWAGIGLWLQEGGRLILAPGPESLPTWLPFQVTALDGDEVQPQVLKVGTTFEERFGKLRVAVPVAGRLKSTETEHRDPLLLAGAEPYGHELVTNDDAEVVVFADDALFRNAALAVPDNALFLHKLLSDMEGGIDIVGPLHGMVSQSPAQSIGRGKLAPFVLQLTLFLLVFYAAKGIMFNRPRAPVIGHRRRFVEHVRAIATLYQRGKAYDHALTVLGAFTTERLRDRFRLGGQGGIGRLAEHISARTGDGVGESARLLMEIEEPIDPVDAPISRGKSTEARTERNRSLEGKAQAVTRLHTLLTASAGRGAETSPATNHNVRTP
ncbi:MAG: DUF4350 domain-containing protein [Deltaproteobacteria bacterium]|nr:DUF4350 domain-containing protein [Deltaproteobacteria bacterium]